MASPLLELILARIRDRGPITVAEYMDLTLYHPQYGYYCTVPRRSGRDGDFFTSVDVGPLFGELIAAQLAELWSALAEGGTARFDLVEAGASDGRLAHDILESAARDFPCFYRALHVTLVDRSSAAVPLQRQNLARHIDRATVGQCKLPRGINGAIVANELLDALPVHRIVVRNGILHEIHVAASQGALVAIELPPSSPRIARFIERLAVPLTDGAVIEVGLAAVDWIEEAASALERGILLLFDYALDAEQLFSPRHAAGTLVGYRRHVADQEHWLGTPGFMDLTSHVNLTAIRLAASDTGLVPLGAIDQTYFLTSLGITERLHDGQDVQSIRGRLAARTLLMPGGLGSTMKAIGFGKDVGQLSMRGFASGRLT